MKKIKKALFVGLLFAAASPIISAQAEPGESCAFTHAKESEACHGDQACQIGADQRLAFCLQREEETKS